MTGTLSAGPGSPLALGGLFSPVPVRANAYTAKPGEFVPCDTTGGAFTVTLPAQPQDGCAVEVKMVRQGGTSAVTVAAAGGDTFNVAGGSQAATLALLYQGAIFQYRATIGVWYILGDDLALSQLDARYLGSGFSNPMTTLGDTLYEGAGPAAARLPGDTSNTRKFLRAQAIAGVAQAPGWDTIQPADLAPVSPAPSKYQPLLYGAVWGYPYKFYPDNYNAKGDGVVVTDGAMTSGGGTALACVSSAPFSSGSVGKSIMVSGAGGTYAPKAGTIASFTDAAHVACSFSATANTGGTPGVITYFGTDDTAALQAQLNAAYAYVLAHGYAEFLLDPSLVYIAGGPFNVNTGNSLLGNSQIGLPNASMTSMCGELAMLGGGSAAPLMSWLQLFPSAPGGIIASTRTDGTNNATFGPASVIGGPVSTMGGEPGTFSNICIRVAGLGILAPYNVNTVGLDLFSMIEADVESFSGFAAAVVPASSAPGPSLATPGNLTAAFSAALRMPCAGNQVVCRAGQLRAEGWIYGWLPSEWTHGQDIHSMYSVGAAGLYSGNGVSMVHNAVIDWMQAENCTNALIQVDNGTKRIRASIGTESISSGSHVFDPSNLIAGDIDFYPQGGAGAYSNWANGHGLNLRMRNMMTVPGTLGPPAVPATTVPLFNYYGRNATVYVTSGGAAVTAITVTTPGGTAITTGLSLGTTGTVAVWVPIGYSITLTYASTAPTWVWQGD